MELKKMKNILLLLFLLINLFLATSLYLNYEERMTVKTDILEDVAAVLSKNEIDIEGSIIPPRRLSMASYFYTETADNEGELERIKAILKEGERLESFNKSGTHVTLQVSSQQSFNTKEAALSFAEKCVNALLGEETGYLKTGEAEGDDEYVFTFSQTIGENVISGLEIKASAQKDGTFQIEGDIILYKCNLYENARLYDAVNALLRTVTHKPQTDRIEITGISPVFYLTKIDATGMLYPAWEINFGDELLVLDAKTGDLVKNN